MKIALKYVSNSDGITHSVHVPLSDWEKLLNKLKKYEQALKIKSDLKEAFEQVIQMRKAKKYKANVKRFS